ncbi:hypothetical protein TALK_06655 [Thalassospira alkalitolerans]|uniref:Uncharacterized protein n=1 Tax=Thalassospira alkalitolerans TaxID=1293890 RepID=A0A1Y2LFG4_9PROT|nr:hypothetical protein TALK_06655 [Thalassospira alkalitolerans]
MHSVALLTFQDGTSIAKNFVETKAKTIILRSFEQFVSIFTANTDFPQVKLLQQFFRSRRPIWPDPNMKKGAVAMTAPLHSNIHP